MCRSCISIVLFALALTSCGYFMAGEWEDDPEDWDRIFDTPKGEGIEVVHTHYYRSAHFTYEFEYFVMLRGTPEARDWLFRHNHLEQLDNSQQAERKVEFFARKKPEWFLPEPLAKYEVWVFAHEPTRNFRLFVNRETGDLFLTDYQF